MEAGRPGGKEAGRLGGEEAGRQRAEEFDWGLRIDATEGPSSLFELRRGTQGAEGREQLWFNLEALKK